MGRAGLRLHDGDGRDDELALAAAVGVAASSVGEAAEALRMTTPDGGAAAAASGPGRPASSPRVALSGGGRRQH